MEHPLPCLLDLNLIPFALLDGCKTIRITRTLVADGNFAISVSATPGTKPEPGATLLYLKELAGFTGLVTSVSFQHDEEGQSTMWIFGKEASYLLARRIILQESSAVTGPVESVMKHLVDLNVGVAAGMTRHLTFMKAEADSAQGPEVTFTSWHTNLFDSLKKLAQESGTGFSLKLEPDRRKLIYSFIAGNDRSAEQTLVPRALFSIGLNTARMVRLDAESENSASMVYLLGRNDDGSRDIAPLWLSDEPLGTDRREAACDARSIPRESFGTYGAQKLKRFSQTETIHVTMPVRSSLLENRDFALGDLCSIDLRNVWHDGQLTAVTDIWDGVRWQKKLSFGIPKRTALTRISEKTDEVWEALQT